MKSAGKARNNGLYRHIRTSKEIIRNLLNDYINNIKSCRTIKIGINQVPKEALILISHIYDIPNRYLLCHPGHCRILLHHSNTVHYSRDSYS